MKELFSQNPDDFFRLITKRTETSLLQEAEIFKLFEKEKILIIGAGGSIGSALSQRLTNSKLSNLFFLDRDESSLHRLSLELNNGSAAHLENYFVGDIRDYSSVEEIIANIKPTFVIHAAALKHLSILERFPREGFLVNLIGTMNVAEICVKNNVKHFVNISTDKAAHPTSILGKTKKLAEILTEEIFLGSELIQCSVRFGNVFASRGSAIETFIHQIKNDLSITLSHPDVARFFMSPYEAANLVLAAASLNESGTYIQNMGEEVLIFDVINRLAEFFNANASISISGLRSGEKLHEDLQDGPSTNTKYKSIVRSVHVLKPGLHQEIKNSLPISNNEALVTIEKLIIKYGNGSLKTK